MEAVPKVRLVVLNFDGGDDVVECVGALHRLDWPAGALEVVLVDNASTDGSPEAVARHHPSTVIRRSPTNVGFSANNLALVDLDGVDLVGLVNNDAFVDTGYLRPLVEVLQADASVGAACPKVLLVDRYFVDEVEVPVGSRLDDGAAIPKDGWTRPDDLHDPRPVATAGVGTVLRPVQHADGPLAVTGGAARLLSRRGPVDVVNNVGTVLTPTWYGADRGLYDVDDGSFDEPTDVFAWTGGAVLLRTEYLASVGGFDPALFLYYEDLDLSWRGQEAGWRHRTVPSAVVRHRLAASTQIGSALFRYQTERNRLVVLAAHAPAAVVLWAVARHLVATASYARRDVVAPLLRLRRPSPGLVGLRLRSVAGFLRLLPHALRRRRRRRRPQERATTTTPTSSRPSSSQSPTTGTYPEAP